MTSQQPGQALALQGPKKQSGSAFGRHSRQPTQHPYSKGHQRGVLSAGSFKPSLGKPASTERVVLSGQTKNSDAKATMKSVTTMSMQVMEPTANFRQDQGQIEELTGTGDEVSAIDYIWLTTIGGREGRCHASWTSSAPTHQDSRESQYQQSHRPHQRPSYTD